ncbi:hypothetical protein E5G80_19515, partial [Escherichia coli]|nr:hypothetical protein [Escherichia coli]
ANKPFNYLKVLVFIIKKAKTVKLIPILAIFWAGTAGVLAAKRKDRILTLLATAPEQNIGEMKSISRFYYQVYLKLRATYIIRLTMQTLHNFPSTPNRCAPRASDSTNLCALANREVACPYTP